MTEREYERLRIIKQIIGSIEGIGETNHDKKALSNIDFASAVLEELIDSFVDNSRYKGFEGSRIEIKERSETVIRDILEIIERR